MDIFITGANGQLSKELFNRLSKSYSVVALRKNELDVTSKVDVESAILHYKPTIVIHAAAFTKVDQCEINRRQAFEVNTLGTEYVAQAAQRVGARMFYISTDYVFDGKKCSPYFENDEPNPQSIYGISKWLGEQFVLNGENGTVIRTSWLYGHEGKNFVKTMLELAKKNIEISVVADQIGSPTYINDLVKTIILLFNKKNGIYHVSNSGECSWYVFAKTIFKEAGFNPDLVRPITTEEYRASAPRPQFSVLGHRALHQEKIPSLRMWDEALKEFIGKENQQ